MLVLSCLHARLGKLYSPRSSTNYWIFQSMEDTSKADKSDSMSSRKGDPGAVRLGNFINYYQFHPPEDRIKHLPLDVLPLQNSGMVVCLDVGCNTGDLTQEMFHYISRYARKCGDETTKANESYILGIDIDPGLILRAEAANQFPKNVSYKTLDIMDIDSSSELKKYLNSLNAKQFNVIFCFSVTMWIHLNHGDKGLKQFLSSICKLAELLIIEPQPWKCYQTAVRRLKKSKETFPNISELRMNKNVDSNIENIIQNKHKFQKIYESDPNSWGRRVVIFKRTPNTDGVI